ncbi:ciliogenesis and planar polarity effector 1 isoform X1 [Lampetra fluviatilis]
MQGRLEVLALASIKRRKPWPQIRWMGLDSENLLLLDERRASVLFLPSGRTRRRVPRLHSLLPRVVAMAPSRNGAWLAGVLVSGELFLWHKDTDSLKTAPAHPAVLALTSRAGEQGSTARLWVLPSDEGRRVLLGGAPDGPLLWELRGVDGPPHAVPGSLLLGRWAQLPPPSDVPLPGAADKEAAAHAVFFTDPELGDCCLCSFVFSAGQSLIISSLLLRWLDGSDALFSVAPFSATWHGFACALGSLSPACEAVKSRGAYVARLSSEGHVLAIAVNQRHPQGCGFRGPTLLPKFIRSYWVSDASWLSGDALLACMLKRGALLLVSRLGEPLTLSTHGCSVEFGPALFIPLHPLVTYSASGSADATASHGSAASEADALRQRFSVSAHPRLPFLLASDGYVVTVMRLGGELAPARLVQAALEDVHRTLEDVRIGLAASRLPGEAVLLRSLSVLGAPPPDETVAVDATAAPPPPLPPPPFLQQDPDEWSCGGHRALQGDDLYDDLSDEEEGGAGDAGGGGGPDPHPYVRMEHGRVEFAGMHEESRTAEGEMELTAAGGADLSARLSFAQRRLIVAWHLLLTLRDVDFWDTWMTFTVTCVARLSVLLQFTDRPRGSAGPAGKAASRSVRRDPWPFAVLQLFRRCALVLCWPGEPLPLPLRCSHRRRRHRRALPYGARLSLEVAAALLGGRADTGDTRSHLRSLLAAFSLLSFAEAWLDRACGLVLAPAPDPPVQPPLPEPCLAPPVEPPGEDGDEAPAEVAMEEAMADSVREGLGTGAEIYALCHAPAAADRRVAPTLSGRVAVVGPEWLRSVLHLPARSAGRESSRPAHRLVACWRLLYRHVLQFQQQLQLRHGADDCDEGAAQERLVASRIAAAVQARLQCVDGSFPRQRPLLDIAGEELYLSGSYHEAVHTWRRAVLEDTDSGGRRGAHLQTRHCLALLYAHLRALHLLPALCLCDRMAARLLQPHTDTAPGICERAALAVVRSMGRFMAAYFTNRALYVFPPHSVQTLPPLHTTAAPPPRWRLLPVSRAGVSVSARAQRVSSAWSPEYALELLLVAGLHAEAVWLARTLGDWKTAVAVGLAYCSHDHHHQNRHLHRRRRHNRSLAGADPAGPPRVSLQLPDDLRPARILQEKLQALLQTPLTAPQMDPDGARVADVTAGTASDSAAAAAADEEGEDDAPDALLAALREMLHAAAMAGVDALGPALAGAVGAARERAGGGCLAGLVPPGLYLPAPPLYCPQLGVELQEGDDAALAQEKRSRHGASSALQRALALLRASRCSLPAAQWYIRRLQRVRRTVGKIRAKEGRPPPKPLPPSLLAYTRMRGVALERAGAEGQGTTARVLGCFRELCALCFLLHMRDRLSECCRKYQAAHDSLHSAQQQRGSVFAFDGAVTAQCEAALAWACRLLPFARFLHAEEMLQDLVLSLVAELPPTRQMVEILAQAFPDAEGVRVPLQDKHRSLLKRLRFVNVQDAEEGSSEQQSVSLCLDEQQERRDRFLARVARTTGPVLAHIWEPAANDDHGDDDDDASVSAARFRPLLRSGSADSESAGNADEPAVAAAPGAPDPGASRKRPAVRCFSDSLVRHGAVPGGGLSGSKAPASSSPSSAGATTPVAAAESSGKTPVRKGLSLDGRVGAAARRRRASGGDSKSPFRDEWSDSGSRVAAGNAGTDPAHGTGTEGAAAAAAASASLPPVGSWEFELEDDEYLDFLDLFLGYVLERDLAGGAGQDDGAAGSVPLLAPFTELLRRRELTSLAFEAQAMLKRWVERQGGAHRPLARTNSLPAARERKRGRAIAGTGGAAADAPDEKPPFEAGTLYPALAGLYAELCPESGTSGNRSRVSRSADAVKERPVPRAAGATGIGPEAPFARVGPFGPPPSKLFEGARSKPAPLAGETVREAPSGGLFWARRQAQADVGRLPADESEGSWLELSSADGWGRHPRLTGGAHVAGKSREGAAGSQEVRERMASAEGKLLEWMVRWADRRRPTPGHRAKRATGEGGEGAVMRVRTSTAALLTSLWLLERRQGQRGAPSPGQQDTVVGSARVKVSQRSSEKGGSTDTGYHGSSDTPPPPPRATGQRSRLARHNSAGPVLGPRTQVATVHPALGEEEEEDLATPIAGDELETSDSDVDDVRDSRDDDADRQLGPHGRGRDEPRDESSGEGSRAESPTSSPWSPTASVVKPCRKSSLSFLREEDPGLQLGLLQQQQQQQKGSASRTDSSLRAAPTDGEAMASLYGESRVRAAGELRRGGGGSSYAEGPHAAADAGSGSSRVAFMEEVQRFAQTQQHNFISMMQAVAMSLPGFMSSDQSRHPPPPPPSVPPPPSPPHSHHDHADHDRYHHSRTHHDQTYRGHVHPDRGNHDHTQRDRDHHDRASHDSNHHDETHCEHTHASYRQQPPTPPPVPVQPPPSPPPLPADRPSALPAVPLGNGSLLVGRAAQGPLETGGQAGSATCLSDRGTIELSRPLALEDLDAPGLDFAGSAAAMSASELALPLLTLNGDSQRALPDRLAQPSLSLPPIAAVAPGAAGLTTLPALSGMPLLTLPSQSALPTFLPPPLPPFIKSGAGLAFAGVPTLRAAPPSRPVTAWPPSDHHGQPQAHAGAPHAAVVPPPAPPPPHLDLSQYDPRSLQEAREQQARRSQRRPNVAHAHLNLDMYELSGAPRDGAASLPPPRLAATAGGTGPTAPAPGPAFPVASGQGAAAAAVAVAWPLLGFEQGAASYQTAHLGYGEPPPPPPPPPTVNLMLPPMAVPNAAGQTLALPLLHLPALPPVASPARAPSPPRSVPHLIPLSQLQGIQNGGLPPENLGSSGLQLISTAPPNERDARRRRRRAEETDPDTSNKRPSVSFRPQESIIPTEARPRTCEESQQTEVDLDGDGYVIRAGAFRDMLARQDVLRGAVPSSAELHLFASTSKNAASTRHAATNTTTTDDRRPVLAGHILPPDVVFGLRYPDRQGGATASTAPHSQPSEQVAPAHRFINVVDIDGDQLRDLPAAGAASAGEAARPAALLEPSSAELHLLAASVLNAATPVPGRERQPTPSRGDRLTGRLLLQDDDPAPPPAPLPPAEQQEGAGDAGPAWGVAARGAGGPGGLRGAHGRAAARLRHMDVQLAALQRVAHSVEADFRSAHLLVDTIEQLGGVVLPKDPEVTAGRHAAWRAPATDRELGQAGGWAAPSQWELDVDEAENGHRPSSGTSVDVLGRDVPSPTLPDAGNGELIYGADRDEELRWSGLTGVSDIIADIVRDGGAADMGLSPSQAQRIVAESAARGGGRSPPEDDEAERRRLREWMKQRRLQQLAEFRRERAGLRDRERAPFTSASSKPPAADGKPLKLSLKEKEERDRLTRAQHAERRAEDARVLMGQLLSETAPTPSRRPGAPTPTARARSLTPTRGAVDAFRSRSSSSGRDRPSAHGAARRGTPAPTGLRQTPAAARPRSASAGRTRQPPPAARARAVSFSSRVATGPSSAGARPPRRGELGATRTLRSAEERGRSAGSAAAPLRPALKQPMQSPPHRAATATATALRRPGSGGRAQSPLRAGRGAELPGADARRDGARREAGARMVEERWRTTGESRAVGDSAELSAMSNWSVPDDVRRLLDGDDGGSLLGVPGLPEDRDTDLEALNVRAGRARNAAAAAAGGGGGDDDNDVSQSTGSILCNTDWGAVDYMLASLQHHS